MESPVAAQQDSVNLKNYCRTCGSSTEELISIFDDEGLGYELNIKISTYLHLKVDKSDKLPLNVCVECTTTLISFHNLYVCCMKAKEHYNDIVFPKDSTNLSIADSLEPEMRQSYSIDSYVNDSIRNTEDSVVGDLQSTKSNAIENKALCEHCSKIFDSKKDLIEHLRNDHTDLIFLCDVCKDYLPRSNLLQHMTSHAISLEMQNHNDEEIKCTKCNKLFPTGTKLQRHLKIAHRKPGKVFKCLICNKTFKANRVLKNHYNHIHSDKRKYQCDDVKCRKSFKTDAGLYAHRKTHTATFDYSCHICPKKFKFKVHLARHLTMHSQEKNFFCRFCSKSFGVKDNLNKHLKTHYKLFEFKCHICEFLTSQQRYLTMHMKTSHLVQKV